MDTQQKSSKILCYGVIWFLRHLKTEKVPTAFPMFSGMTCSMTIIFKSSGVAITPEINIADKKRK